MCCKSKQRKTKPGEAVITVYAHHSSTEICIFFTFTPVKCMQSMWIITKESGDNFENISDNISDMQKFERLISDGHIDFDFTQKYHPVSK